LQCAAFPKDTAQICECRSAVTIDKRTDRSPQVGCVVTIVLEHVASLFLSQRILRDAIIVVFVEVYKRRGAIITLFIPFRSSPSFSTRLTQDRFLSFPPNLF